MSEREGSNSGFCLQNLVQDIYIHIGKIGRTTASSSDTGLLMVPPPLEEENVQDG